MTSDRRLPHRPGHRKRQTFPPGAAVPAPRYGSTIIGQTSVHTSADLCGRWAVRYEGLEAREVADLRARPSG